MKYYRNKTVLITGGASGIGRLLALRIGRLGARLVLWDIDEPGLESVRLELARASTDVTVFSCDVSNEAEVAQTALTTIEHCGSVDILINSAGFVTGRLLLELKDEEIRRTFDVNTLALFWTTRAFVPGMIERGGHVVTIASASGLAGAAKLTDYSASKFAAVGFDDALRAELKKAGWPVCTTLVCPFYVDTGMFAGVKTRFSLILPILKPEYVADRIVRAVARKRRRLLMPRFLYVGYPLRLLPVSWFDALVRLLGISKSMDEFVGRDRTRPPTSE